MSKKQKKNKLDLKDVSFTFDNCAAKIEVTENFCDLDNQVALVVQNLKERMAEASTAELDFRTFVDECVNIGARAVAVSRDIDRLQETLNMLKAGMILPQSQGLGDGDQTEKEVPGPTR
jgi:hypothetical protein